MGVIGPQTIGGFIYPAAYARMGSIPQPQKDAKTVRVSLDLYGSRSAYLAVKGTGDKGLCPRWLTVDFYAETPDRSLEPVVEARGCIRLSAVKPDIVRMWGAVATNPTIPSNRWPNNIYAQAWVLLMTLDELDGMDSDAT